MLISLCKHASTLLIGGATGLVSSLVGAYVDYRRARRRPESEEGRLPGCMIMMTGMLGFVGVLSIILSLFADQVTRSLLMGIGVSVGFFFGFFLLVVVWWLFFRNK